MRGIRCTNSQSNPAHVRGVTAYVIPRFFSNGCVRRNPSIEKASAHLYCSVCLHCCFPLIYLCIGDGRRRLVAGHYLGNTTTHWLGGIALAYNAASMQHEISTLKQLFFHSGAWKPENDSIERMQQKFAGLSAGVRSVAPRFLIAYPYFAYILTHKKRKYSIKCLRIRLHCFKEIFHIFLESLFTNRYACSKI